ncbi:alpha-protein kinase 1 [Protopterus annectens]|uniref:alpha-protein kinase 1 n=1 Tax=Protopterus annectens TaxID=7888 RepID=UPI001CF9CB95|nr:alpha-protein kinase 1 [Protopterus annectens]XP_043917485.1 alpha-protein kinase 1 [Protopterus annectens]
MNSQNVVTLLQQCKQALNAMLSGPSEPSEENKKEYQCCEASLSVDLKKLLQEAKEMKWPFVPEKWQYKQAVQPEDKINLKDVISASLPELLVYLKASVMVRDCTTAAAIVFLIDRFLYWVDASSKLLQVAKAVHELCPTTPIAPQVVLRQARISVNSGKLLKAEYILSSLIINSGATGSWVYEKESDRILVQAVSIQIRGQILQKLGMWYEAAELIWASIVGFSELPQIDKKGVSTSLGILADIFVSIDDEDYQRFKEKPYIDLSMLKEFDHRLLAAAEAAKLAAVFTQYTPLFVLINVNIRGTCLLSYSFSSDCPSQKRELYLLEAKESFEIGLLTKKDDEPITSKQELHGFLKAAFSLTVVHEQLNSKIEALSQVRQMCKEALHNLYQYTCLPEGQKKWTLAEEIMKLVKMIKANLKVQNFPNSDDRSYVPDCYKNCAAQPIVYGSVTFNKVLEMHAQYHATTCQVFKRKCRDEKYRHALGPGPCITALKTETRSIDTACITEDSSFSDGVTNSSCKDGTDSKSLKDKESKKLPMRRQDAFSQDETAESNESVENKKVTPNLPDRSLSGSHNSSSLSSWEDVSGDAGLAVPPDWVSVDTNCPTACTDEATKDIQDRRSVSVDTDMQQLSLHSTGEDHPGISHSCFEAGSFSDTVSSFSKRLKEDISSVAENTKHDSNKMHRENLDLLPATTTPTEVEHGGRTSASSEELNSFEVIDTEADTVDDLEVNSKKCGVTDVVSRPEMPGKPVSSLVDCHTHFKIGDVSCDATTQDETQDPSELNIVSSATNHISVIGDPFYIDESLRKNIPLSSPLWDPSEVSAVDTQAETADDLGNTSSAEGYFPVSPPAVALPKQNSNELVRKDDSLEDFPLRNDLGDMDTEVDEDNQISNFLSSSQSSTSSFRSWHKVSRLSNSFSIESHSFLNSSGDSFEFVPRNLEACILHEDDYRSLLSGVHHRWLLQRLQDTGIFKPGQHGEAYDALLLKYSKKSDLWTAQETVIQLGDYLRCDKKGVQRNAFWIHFLHQEESVGRYVGKEYKKAKELHFHLNDVERQTTAQYYVTEFNKRLYEKKIPTQMFYIPAAVLLILEGREIKGCISAEPYMLGEFVKLTNNTKTVKKYGATEYGLAFGHFTYQFSNCKEIVVDLQGWVTDDGKGLIYLTDPQIHSVSQGKSRTNFAHKGIGYFFEHQHVECNDICRELLLTRPKPVWVGN